LGDLFAFLGTASRDAFDYVKLVVDGKVDSVGFASLAQGDTPSDRFFATWVGYSTVMLALLLWFGTSSDTKGWSKTVKDVFKQNAIVIKVRYFRPPHPLPHLETDLRSLPFAVSSSPSSWELNSSSSLSVAESFSTSACSLSSKRRLVSLELLFRGEHRSSRCSFTGSVEPCESLLWKYRFSQPSTETTFPSIQVHVWIRVDAEPREKAVEEGNVLLRSVRLFHLSLSLSLLPLPLLC